MKFTIAETAALIGLEERQIWNELEKRVIKTRRSGSEPRVTYAAFVYLAWFRDAARTWPRSFSPALRAELVEAIADSIAEPTPPQQVTVRGLLSISVTKAQSDWEKAARFRKWRDTIVTDNAIKGGEAVFPNSRVSVRHVGKLLQRGPAARREVGEDYPFLTDDDLEFAPIFVRASPRVGRPIAQASA